TGVDGGPNIQPRAANNLLIIAIPGGSPPHSLCSGERNPAMAFLRPLAVVLVIAAVVAALAGYHYSTENRVTAEQVVKDSFEVKGAPHVVVETFNGAVEIVTTPESRVVAQVTKRASASNQEAAKERLDEIEVTMSQGGDTVRIAASQTAQFWSAGRRSTATFVQVPADSALELRTSNGAIKVTGSTGEV